MSAIIDPSSRITRPKFSVADADRAYAEWGCNCGPTALAAVCDLTLDQVRPLMGDFERKRYTNPTLMLESLTRTGRRWRRLAADEKPATGLLRIQWEGPWTAPGVPMRARYRHTHWIGYATGRWVDGAFDCNCLNNGSGWVAWPEWQSIVAPWLIREAVPRGNGAWHVTHSIEVL